MHNLEKEYGCVQFLLSLIQGIEARGFFITVRLTTAQNRSVIVNFLFSELQEREDYVAHFQIVFSIKMMAVWNHLYYD